MLDLVKCFERTPHNVLVREVVSHNYPLWLLRLSFVAYRLGRVIRVGNAISNVLTATRGIIAGSGLATIELRVLMIDIVDRALAAHPTVTPTLYVDDLSMESSGTNKHVCTQRVGFVRIACERFVADELEVSRTKSVCSADTDAIGSESAGALAEYDIKYCRRVKSLGFGLGGGVRRNVGVVRRRLKEFRFRINRYR